MWNLKIQLLDIRIPTLNATRSFSEASMFNILTSKGEK